MPALGRRPLVRLHLLFLLFSMPAVAAAGEDAGAIFAAGCRAELAGDHAAAAVSYGTAADAGIREAMFALGRLHRDGLGVAADPEAAFARFLAAAERGHLLARFEVGLAYRDGRGTEPDRELAREWLSAAALRHGPAAYALFEIEERPDRQREWLRRAGELGHVAAMKELARAYGRGAYGLAVSPAASRAWAGEAERAERGEEPRR